MKKAELKKLIKEEFKKLNELYNFGNYIESWMDTEHWGTNKEVPRAIFLYLKKLGYEKFGTIYRVLTIEGNKILIIKQQSTYYDLIGFIEDKLKGDEPPEDIYDDLYDLYGDEQEVIAPISNNIKIEKIDSRSHMVDFDIKKKSRQNIIIKNILKKDGGKLVSFSKTKEAAETIYNDLLYTK